MLWCSFMINLLCCSLALQNGHPALKENATARSAIPDLEEKKFRKTVCKAFTKPIYFLDPWNNRNLHLASLDAVKLREMRPDYIPVIMEKDARSDVPDVDMRRCHVYDGTPLREFVHFLRGHIHSKKPIFVFFKNTKPPNSALMSAIHEENKDEDGFLYVTYSGEKSYINGVLLNFLLRDMMASIV
ncbi:autophagy-related protein 8C-like [Pyrus ussuriensis x Pyrus communis]|uniref:Autophagy-related protein n=1 Tax=Pyrus ussuriensis x Pyrus communis TaxID=2448454 RepID=A0A5N5H6L3_9ROSA|nr:autophagy-related protein 8C-like [Pyrus ussuriensis x Pyrus communis]